MTTTPSWIDQQNAWMNAQMDTEMYWIVQETLSTATQQKNSFRHVFSSLADMFAAALIERDPALDGRLEGSHLYKLAAEHSATRSEDWKAASRTVQARDILHIWLSFVQMLRMGMPSPWAKPESDGYWPFGQEGGFCNPMKLKLLNE